MNSFFYRTQQWLFVSLAFFIPISIAATNVVIGCIVFLWLFTDGIKERIDKIKNSESFFILFLFFCCYIGGLFWGESHSDASYVFQKLSLLLFFPIIITTEISQKSLKLATVCFLLTNFIASIVSIAINMDIIHPLNFYLSFVEDSDKMAAFTKYNYHSILLTFATILSLYILIEEKIKFKVLLYIAITTYCISIFLGLGRVGYVLVTFFLVYFSVYYLNKNSKITFALIFALSLLLTWGYNLSDVFKNRVNHTILVLTDKKEREFDERTILWEKTMKKIKNKPIFIGHGTGSFSELIDNKINILEDPDKVRKEDNNQKDKEGISSEHKSPHNNYLYIWFELGIVALIVFLIFFYYQIKELLFLKHGAYRASLPILFIMILFIDDYFFIFTIMTFYMYFYKICSSYLPK